MADDVIVYFLHRVSGYVYVRAGRFKGQRDGLNHMVWNRQIVRRVPEACYYTLTEARRAAEKLND